MKKILISALTVAMIATSLGAQTTEKIKYGDMNHWITRPVKESKIIGGKTKTLYEIGPDVTVKETYAYHNLGGSPWATSNVYAHVSGVTKGSTSVFPFQRGEGDKAVKMSTLMEKVKVLGLINMSVMVSGSIFLGKMVEPVTSTSDPFSKMEMGIPYTKRPKAVKFDYKVDMPNVNTRVKATGFGSKKTLQGRDTGAMYVLLQRRWEDAQGNLHAKRVATGGQTFGQNQPTWVNGHQVKLHYGDASTLPQYKWLGLRNGAQANYAYNSKGKLVKVIEEGWDDADAKPTHMLMLFSAGNSEPYIGTEGLNFYVDNVELVF